jgi:uncharacterized membrane protein YuzA (DUF378 family)
MFILNILSLIFVVVSAVNTGLIGFFNYNLLNMIFGGAESAEYTMIARIVYAIIGLFGLWAISFFRKTALFKCCGGCKRK